MSVPLNPPAHWAYGIAGQLKFQRDVKYIQVICIDATHAVTDISCPVEGPVPYSLIACYPHLHSANLLSTFTISGQAPCGGLVPPHKAPHSDILFLPATADTSCIAASMALPYPAATSSQAASAASPVSFWYAYPFLASSYKCARSFS